MEENNQISFPNGMISNKVRGNDASDMLMYFNVSSAFKEYISRSGGAKSYVNSAAGLDQSGFARDQASTALGFFRYLGVNPETRRYVLPLSIVRRDSAGKMLESITFVTNPSEMTRSVSHASDAAMTRSNHVVTISGRNQTRISLRGKSPAFYGAEGLSCERMLLEGGIITSRDMSAGFLHMRMLQDIIRRDGITGLDHVDLGTGVAYDSFAATMRNRVIPLALDDFGLAYDGVEYNGSFASFSIDESAESPYIIDYNIEFVVSSIGGIGFAGHRDLDPKGGRKVFTANQDDIVDAQTLSFAGLKVPVPVGEYAKAMALAQANAALPSDAAVTGIGGKIGGPGVHCSKDSGNNWIMYKDGKTVVSWEDPQIREYIRWQILAREGDYAFQNDRGSGATYGGLMYINPIDGVSDSDWDYFWRKVTDLLGASPLPPISMYRKKNLDLYERYDMLESTADPGHVAWVNIKKIRGGGLSLFNDPRIVSIYDKAKEPFVKKIIESLKGHKGSYVPAAVAALSDALFQWGGKHLGVDTVMPSFFYDVDSAQSLNTAVRDMAARTPSSHKLHDAIVARRLSFLSNGPDRGYASISCSVSSTPTKATAGVRGNASTMTDANDHGLADVLFIGDSTTQSTAIGFGSAGIGGARKGASYICEIGSSIDWWLLKLRSTSTISIGGFTGTVQDLIKKSVSSSSPQVIVCLGSNPSRGGNTFAELSGIGPLIKAILPGASVYYFAPCGITMSGSSKPNNSAIKLRHEMLTAKGNIVAIDDETILASDAKSWGNYKVGEKLHPNPGTIMSWLKSSPNTSKHCVPANVYQINGSVQLIETFSNGILSKA